MHSLGLLLAKHPELPRAPGEEVEMLSSAAQAGTWQSSATLGMLAREGRDLPQDTTVSYRWLRIAVLQGGVPAESCLQATLDREKKELGESAAALADRDAKTWLLAHPNQDLFLSRRGVNTKYSPLQEVYAAVQAPQSDKKTEATN